MRDLSFCAISSSALNLYVERLYLCINSHIFQLDRLGQEQLASRMTLNCAKSACLTARIAQLPMTIIDVYDDCALSTEARELVHRAYPLASKASLKTGGNFPYLSRDGEVNVHIQVG